MIAVLMGGVSDGERYTITDCNPNHYTSNYPHTEKNLYEFRYFDSIKNEAYYEFKKVEK